MSDLLSSNNLVVTINEPTRVTETTSTIIDYVITNINPKHHCTQVIKSLISDHYAQSIEIDTHVSVPHKITLCREIRNMMAGNVEGLCILVQNADWSEVFNETDVNLKWETFYAIFTHNFNIACPIYHIPTKSTKVQRNWITKDIIIAKSKLMDYYNKLLITKRVRQKKKRIQSTHKRNQNETLRRSRNEAHSYTRVFHSHIYT